MAYDSINGEQIKCFPIAFHEDGEIVYNNGEYRNYETGEKVPFKRPYYNYGRNFIILDVNDYNGTKFEDMFNYEYIIHVIEDGKVKATYRNEIGEIQWDRNQSVLSYVGEFLNVKSSKDISDYIAERREYLKELEEISSKTTELFNKYMNCYTGYGLLPKEEKLTRKEKINISRKEYLEEKNRVEPDVKRIVDSFSKRWHVKDKYEDCIKYGEYLYAYTTTQESKDECTDKVLEMMEKDPTLENKYNIWQMSDLYIKNFQEGEEEYGINL